MKLHAERNYFLAEDLNVLLCNPMHEHMDHLVDSVRYHDIFLVGTIYDTIRTNFQYSKNSVPTLRSLKSSIEK
jgi:hypothetical protein